ncbi:unnamed protein product, partial [Phaeothamnion confervicola]
WETSLATSGSGDFRGMGGPRIARMACRNSLVERSYGTSWSKLAPPHRPAPPARQSQTP